MNKRLVYLFAVLVIGLFVMSACQQDAVGRRINPTIDRGIANYGNNPNSGARILSYFAVCDLPGGGRATFDHESDDDNDGDERMRKYARGWCEKRNGKLTEE